MKGSKHTIWPSMQEYRGGIEGMKGGGVVALASDAKEEGLGGGVTGEGRSAGWGMSLELAKQARKGLEGSAGG